MLLLTSTSDILRVVTTGGADINVHASWVDWSGTTATPGRTNTAITTATTTTIVAAPLTTVQRNVKVLLMRNVDITSNVVTLQHYDGTTSITMLSVTLLPNETIEYTENVGFVVLDVNGQRKVSYPNQVQQALASNHSESTATLTEVTGLTIALDVGVYVAEYHLIYQSVGATTTGARFSANFDGTATSFVQNVYWGGGTTDAVATIDQVSTAPIMLSGFAARVGSTTTIGTTTDVDTQDADCLAFLRCTFVVTVAGNLELWHGSETTSASLLKAGSSVVVQKMS
jgi:hypothetical protein